MKLKIKERLIIPSILPKKGDFITLTIKKDLLEKLQITQEEIKELDITQEGENIKWDSDKETDKNFDITELEIKMIKDSLKDKDEKRELTDELLDLYKIFNK